MTMPLGDYRAELIGALGAVATIELPIGDALGSSLAQDIVAARSLPPADVADTDGYALHSQDAVEPTSLPVAFDVDAGDLSPRVHVRGTAVRVTSGAPIPRGADTVIPAADTDGGIGSVRLSRAALQGEHVRPRGFDAAEGAIVVPAGRRLGPRELGLAAALGYSRLAARPVPRVVVIAVGGELVDPHSDGDGVPEANTHMLAALVEDAGARAYRVGAVPDEPGELAAALEDQVVRADVILTTGGLSGGRHDTLVDVLRTIGTGVAYDVGLAPGARHARGTVGGRNVPVVCLPGHPVSALVAFEAYVRPALRAMSGFAEVNRVTIRAEFAGEWHSAAGITEALPVVLDLDDEGVVRASALADGQGGVSFVSAVASDGLAWIRPSVTELRPGDEVRCTVWDR